MIKVPILYTYFKMYGDGKLNDTIIVKKEDEVEWSVISDISASEYSHLDLLTLMICYSDNTATNVMIDLLTMEKINETMKDAGLKDTKIQRKMMDSKARKKGFDNFTSASDMAHLFEMIYKEKGYVLEILKKQRDNGSLKRFLSEDIVAAHKTGGLDGINHDMGIFRTDEKPYLLGVFTQGAYNNYETKDFIGAIGKKVYEEGYKNG